MAEALGRVAGALKERGITLYEEVKDKGIGGAIAGVTKIALDVADDYLAYQQMLGQLLGFDKPLIQLGIGVVGSLIDPERVGKYTSPLITVGVADALHNVYRIVTKQPYGYVAGKNKVIVYNLEGNKAIELWIDGTAVNINATTDSAGKATITLPSELSAGDHYIIVKAGAKAVQLYVKV